MLGIVSFQQILLKIVNGLQLKSSRVKIERQSQQKKCVFITKCNFLCYHQLTYCCMEPNEIKISKSLNFVSPLNHFKYFFSEDIVHCAIILQIHCLLFWKHVCFKQ